MRKLDPDVIKNYAQSIISMAEMPTNYVPDMDAIVREAKTLLAYVQAPDVCGECRGLATDCKVCGGRAYIAEHVRGRRP